MAQLEPVTSGQPCEDAVVAEPTTNAPDVVDLLSHLARKV